MICWSANWAPERAENGDLSNFDWVMAVGARRADLLGLSCTTGLMTLDFCCNIQIGWIHSALHQWFRVVVKVVWWWCDDVVATSGTPYSQMSIVLTQMWSKCIQVLLRLYHLWCGWCICFIMVSFSPLTVKCPAMTLHINVTQLLAQH